MSAAPAAAVDENKKPTLSSDSKKMGEVEKRLEEADEISLGSDDTDEEDDDEEYESGDEEEEDEDEEGELGTAALLGPLRDDDDDDEVRVPLILTPNRLV